MEKKNPPPYTEQPQPESVPQLVAQPQPAYPQAQIGFQPAQTYQPYPMGPTQPPMYPAMQQPAGQCVIVNSTRPAGQCVLINTTTVSRVPVGRDPTFVRCPSCQNDVVTTIQSTATGRTHLWALVLCLVGCWPCVCIPYCMESCKSTNHYCPVCNAFIGTRAI